ncbi:MAG: DUF3098 domain-containing protein [Bacteroidales bacterium]
MKTKENTTKNSAAELVQSEEFMIPKRNIRYIIAGLVIMILGYIVMMGGGSEDPNVFNESMFSTLRTVIAPVLILAGMVVEIWAIMYRGKDYKE